MFVAVRGGLAVKLPFSRATKELCKIHPNKNIKYQVATLTRAAFREESEVPNIKPFPYHEKEYTIFQLLCDSYKSRLHKHNKLIVVDGQVAAGKHKFAKEIAEEFDFLYLPSPTFDDLYITPWGFDMRTLDPKLPENIRSWDIERYLHDPTNLNTAAMQMYMLYLRQQRYINCLAHVLCTGQGVVTVRSPWTDKVFAKAMIQNKYISPGAYEAHSDACSASLHYYFRPHLIIYLDVPVENTIQNIKKRGLKHEINAKVLNEKYLSDIEENYKRDYLAKLSPYCHLLIYDWSKGGDIEVVVDDIEALNFDNIDEHDTKLEDWSFQNLQHRIFCRHFTYHRDELLQHMWIMRTDVPELIMSGNECEEWDNVWLKVPDSQYDEGYNVLKGDKNVMWKSKFVLNKDYVTPLMKKYYERKNREKARVTAS